MITSKPLESAPRKRLLHRIFHGSDGSLGLLSSNGKWAVRITERQWQALLSDFDKSLVSVNRILRWGFVLALPVLLATMILMWQPSMRPLTGFIGYRVTSFLIITWWPLLLIGWHALVVRRLNRRMDARLVTMPAIAVPSGRPVFFQTLEIVALVLVGPGLLISIVGNIYPSLLVGTPLVGAHLEFFSILGLLVFGALLARKYWPLWRARAASTAAMTQSDEPHAQPHARRSDPLARARQAET